MKKTFTIILGLIGISCLFTSCFGLFGKKAEPKTCAMVMEKSNNSYDISEEAAEQVFGQLEEVISQRPDLRVIDRTKFETVKNELAFQQSDWSNKEKTAEIGRALNADMICFVTIYKDAYKVEFLNVNTVQKRTYNGKISVNLITKSVTAKGLKGLKTLNIKGL